MSESLLGRFTANEDERQSIERTVGKLKSVQELMADLIAVAGGPGFVATLGEASPWLRALGETAAEVVGPVRFVVKLLEKVTGRGRATELGELACTLAYQAALVEAVPRVVQGALTPEDREAFLRAADSYRVEPKAFDAFSLANFGSHPFITQSDLALAVFAKMLGLDDARARKLQQEVHRAFPTKLKSLLSDRSTRDRFAPWTSLLEFGAQEAVREALADHVAWHRARFRESPVLGVEPFALRDVYIDTQCGATTWRELRGASNIARGVQAGVARDEKPDAFDEQVGGRHDLLDTVLRRMRDDDFHDAIVVQGVAGAGKSSFTLRLVEELDAQGLRPILVRLRDLPNDERHIREALPRAIQCGPEGTLPVFGSEALDERSLRSDGPLFTEQITFGKATICPYVLILDGWDEVQTGSKGIHSRLEKHLQELRAEYLDRRNGPRVRVILTGRPSAAIHESRFMRDGTVVLTLRALEPSALDRYSQQLKQALDQPRLGLPATWKLAEDKRALVVKHYQKQFSRLPGARSLDILGQPLLAFLALRLVAERNGEIEELLTQPTVLYRRLIDLTVGQGGQPRSLDSLDSEGRARVWGTELRRLLQEMAAAVTMHGTESISGHELARRLEMLDVNLSSAIGFDQRPLSVLLLCFFFQTGQEELGNEFVHKSFREYLFAECVVECLKDFGRIASMPLAERETHWKDFDEADLRRALSRKLALRVAGQWLTPEILGHVDRLIEWEVSRAVQPTDEVEPKECRTKPLDLSGWLKIRDVTSDLWGWWADSVPMRAQPQKDRGRDWRYKIPYSVELAENLMSDPPGRNDEPRSPLPLNVLDAHLGRALLHVAVCVHAALLAHPLRADVRRWQEKQDEGPVRFAPAQKDPDLFLAYCARIAAGGGEELLFPFKATLRHASLRHVPCFLLALNEADLRGTDFFHADLSGADLRGADLREAKLHGANLRDANLSDAKLCSAKLSGADLRGANLRGAELRGAVFQDADLREADLRGADFSGADLSGADLREAALVGADLSSADLRGADLREVDLSGADLRGADLRGADLREANLHGADLREADLHGADLREALLPDGLVLPLPPMR